MTNGRRISPKGAPAVRGPAPSLEAARFEKELLKEHPELRAFSFDFTKDEVLIKEGLVWEERLAFLVIEGTLAEGQTHFVDDGGHRRMTLFQVGTGGIAFVQCLVAAYANLPALTSVIAETDGRGYQIPIEWLEKVMKSDRLHLLSGQIALRNHMLTSLIKLRTGRVLDKDISEIAANMLRTNPETAVPVHSLKQAIVRRLRAGEEAENRLADAEIAAADAETKLGTATQVLAERDAEIERLKRDLEASREREKTASDGSREAFDYLEAEQERQERQARSAAKTWKLLEEDLRRIPHFQLSPRLKAAMLGFDESDCPIGKDIGQAVENIFDEAIGRPSARPAPNVPEPVTQRSTPPTRELPSFIGDDDEREDTLVGVQSVRQMLPAQKPFQLRKPGAFAGLTELGRPPPVRSKTPLGVKVPTVPPPPSNEPIRIVAPASQRTADSSPDIEFEEEEPRRETRNWGFASDLGTAPKK